MAIVQNPVTGRTRKKMSNVIFSKWKVVNTMRSKPLSVENPRSPGQVTQRSKFSFISNLARQALGFFRSSLKAAAVRMSEYNYFVSQNIGLVQDSPIGILPPDSANLVISAGPIAGLDSLLASAAAGRSVTVVWDSAYLASQREAADTVCLVLYDTANVAFEVFEDSALFSLGTLTVVSDLPVGALVQPLLCVRRPRNNRFSPTFPSNQVTLLA